MLRLSAELYETASNKLIASLNVQGANLTEILQAVRKKSPGFFRSIMGGPADYVDEEVVDNTKKESKKFYAVEIATRMIGAIPSIDGNVIPNCTETPCKTMVEEGRRIKWNKVVFLSVAPVELRKEYELGDDDVALLRSRLKSSKVRCEGSLFFTDCCNGNCAMGGVCGESCPFTDEVWVWPDGHQGRGNAQARHWC